MTDTSYSGFASLVPNDSIQGEDFCPEGLLCTSCVVTSGGRGNEVILL